ncbi:MAG: hypothetical protein COY58_09330 [Gammaproteobacteria bacterium CG_4_10_14_0_8_um_filter_38_16]|nr:MAG: hypothetical protein COY58_09330 [Gammaproteobacteria bacterium CG_4_10_14_0_8_um_filter_38_16]PJA03574.1 MAG: hypothetical protein COX72_04530 [Gammaproteobacteria bacterium CG_4_10_14_0_2_um_filter_38_22]PJB10143.1 MAG: hypothetical protein CO120_06440 [Gammaproteobacteria bacterium CG_4_9_14_3_um_filter_38_9]
MEFEVINYLPKPGEAHSWVYDMGIAIVGGLIAGSFSGIASGYFVYDRVVKVNENKREIRLKEEQKTKEEREKKHECTKAFLTVQTKLILQMCSLKGLLTTVENILNCDISGETIREIFSGGFDRKIFESKKYDILKPSSIHVFTDYLITPLSSDIIIDIPFQIYDMNNFKGKENLSVYFNDLSSHNKNYFDIIELINRNNHMRDLLLLDASKDNLNPNILELVTCSSLNMAFSLCDKIKLLIISENKSFKKAQKYISELGLTSPLQVELDELEIPIFDKKE